MGFALFDRSTSAVFAAIFGLALWPAVLLAFREKVGKRGWELYWGFGWGIIVAPILVLTLGLGYVTPARFPFLSGDLIWTGFVGPILEEACKGLGVVLILWFTARRGRTWGPLGYLVLLGGSVGFGFTVGEAVVQAWAERAGGDAINHVTFGVEMVAGYLHAGTTALVALATGIWSRSKTAAVAVVVLATGIHVLNNSAVVLGRGLGLEFFLWLGLLVFMLFFWQGFRVPEAWLERFPGEW